MQLPNDGSSADALHVRAARALQAAGAPMSADNLNAMMDRIANASPTDSEGMSGNANDEALARYMSQTGAEPQQPAAPVAKAAAPARNNAPPGPEQGPPVAPAAPTAATPSGKSDTVTFTTNDLLRELAIYGVSGAAAIPIAKKLLESGTAPEMIRRDPSLVEKVTGAAINPQDAAVTKLAEQTGMKDPIAEAVMHPASRDTVVERPGAAVTRDPVAEVVMSDAARDTRVERPTPAPRDPVADAVMNDASRTTTVKQSATDPNGEKPHVRIQAGSNNTDAMGNVQGGAAAPEVAAAAETKAADVVKPKAKAPEPAKPKGQALKNEIAKGLKRVAK